MARILIADDSETILLLLRTRLEMEGYDVTTASDGEEVMEFMARAAPEDAPDLILLDAMMPRKSGIDVLKELRETGLETPVLIVSAHQEHVGLGGDSDGMASGYIRKPIDFDVLLERVAELTRPAASSPD
jgi:DNA-binding response OmpR family regulator